MERRGDWQTDGVLFNLLLLQTNTSVKRHSPRWSVGGRAKCALMGVVVKTKTVGISWLDRELWMMASITWLKDLQRFAHGTFCLTKGAEKGDFFGAKGRIPITFRDVLGEGLDTCTYFPLWPSRVSRSYYDPDLIAHMFPDIQ